MTPTGVPVGVSCFMGRRAHDGSEATAVTEKFVGYYRLLEALDKPGCPICRCLLEDGRRHLDALLYEQVTDVETRRRLRAAWGLCNWHTWMLPTLGGGMTGAACSTTRSRSGPPSDVGSTASSAATSTGPRRRCRRPRPPPARPPSRSSPAPPASSAMICTRTTAGRRRRMENTWFLAAVWIGLALVATLLAIWCKISTALSEIVVGTVAQLVIGVIVGPNALGS